MKTHALLFALPLTAITALAALGAASEAAAAEMIQENRAAAGFHRIEIDGQVNITLVQGASEGVTVEAEAAALPRIRTDVHGDTLSVDAEISRSVWQWFSGRGVTRTPHITIYFKDVERIETAGSVTLDAENLKSGDLRLDLSGACTVRIRDLQANSLRMDGSGAIKVAFAGKVGQQKIDLSGASSYDAARLLSTDAVIDVSGAGKAVINASNSLAVDISGAGKVEYLGDPKLRQTISGIGKIARREGD